MRARVWSLVMRQVDQIATRASSSPRRMESSLPPAKGFTTTRPGPASRISEPLSQREPKVD